MRAGLALALLLLTASCKDEGVEKHRQALEKYSACITRGAPPEDPCFNEVLTILETIPSSSKVRVRSDALRDGLLTARQPKIRTPLAIQGGQCQRLAEQLGTTPEAERPAKLRELEACRANAEKLEHAEEDGGTR